MTLYQYNQLKEEDQYTVLWADSHLVAQIKEDDFAKNLYSLYDFWVEVWYDVGENKIDHLRTFRSLSQLEPYLEFINLGL